MAGEEVGLGAAGAPAPEPEEPEPDPEFDPDPNPAPPSNFPAKHCVINSTSFPPVGVSDST